MKRRIKKMPTKEHILLLNMIQDYHVEIGCDSVGELIDIDAGYANDISVYDKVSVDENAFIEINNEILNRALSSFIDSSIQFLYIGDKNNTGILNIEFFIGLYRRYFELFDESNSESLKERQYNINRMNQFILLGQNLMYNYIRLIIDFGHFNNEIRGLFIYMLEAPSRINHIGDGFTTVFRNGYLSAIIYEVVC